MPTISEQIVNFYSALDIQFSLPEGIEVMNPFKTMEVKRIINSFYSRFFNDNNKRIMILGINPGRFGGGVTGIPFTDPIRLEKQCGIANTFNKKPELSSVFIYDVISAFGGPEQFYSIFYISAISPLGFLKDGKNYNYYDSKELLIKLHDFIGKCFMEQMDFGITTDICFCLGAGRNLEVLKTLNEDLSLFNNIYSLPHPRWIMQYRQKRRGEFVKLYVDALKTI
ncbi:MAG: DUF4918 family protein [Bacteroidetes bacterium]|nr:DUF4918 family protein [Bacteroidota bacterium]